MDVKQRKTLTYKESLVVGKNLKCKLQNVTVTLMKHDNFLISAR